jgi:hypothetical protein
VSAAAQESADIALLRRSEADAAFGLQTVREWEQTEEWWKLTPIRREIAAHLAMNESEAMTGTLARDPVWALAARSGYTGHQITHTFKVLRKRGLIHSKGSFIEEEQGRRRGPSKHLPTVDAPYVPSEKKQRAALEGWKKKRLRTTGRVPFSPAEAATAQAAMRNRKLLVCPGCNESFVVRTHNQKTCSGKCNKRVQRARKAT